MLLTDVLLMKQKNSENPRAYADASRNRMTPGDRGHNNNKRTGRGRYNGRRDQRLGIMLAMLVVFLLMAIVGAKGSALREKRDTLRAKEELLLQKIGEQEARSEEIAEYEKYTQTRKFYEEVAKDKLGLIYEGEIIFKSE